MQNKVKVEIRNVALSFGTTEVLKDIDLTIEAGEFFALLGPSGSGKSTLLRLIAGFNRPGRGAVLINGEDVTRIPPWERNVGMVFQNYALWPHMTVWQNVAFGLEERRLPRGAVRDKVAAALDMVGLGEYAQRRPSQLSGGQQQRVALARTIAVEPKVLLLDEPLSNLDAKLRIHMRQEILSLQRKLGITTIFVTHDQEEALTTSDRIAVLDAGIIQQIGTPMDLYDRPANRFVANFVGTINLLQGAIEKTAGENALFVSPQIGGIGLPKREDMPWHGAVEIAFRPHGVVVSREELPGNRIWLKGEVQALEFLGEFVRYTVRVNGTEIIADQAHLTGVAPFAPGTRVHVGIAPEQLRFLTV